MKDTTEFAEVAKRSELGNGNTHKRVYRWQKAPFRDFSFSLQRRVIWRRRLRFKPSSLEALPPWGTMSSCVLRHFRRGIARCAATSGAIPASRHYAVRGADVNRAGGTGMLASHRSRGRCRRQGRYYRGRSTRQAASAPCAGDALHRAARDASQDRFGERAE